MGMRSAWQAIAQSPRRFLASSWPWRSLAYLLCGIAPSAAVAAGLILLIGSSPASSAAPFVLPAVLLALLLSGPLVARYEWWRLRLMEADPAADTAVDPGPDADMAVDPGPDAAAHPDPGAVDGRSHPTRRSATLPLRGARRPAGRVPAGPVPTGRVPAGPLPAGRVPPGVAAGYGVVSVLVLWLIDLAVVGLSLVIPVGLAAMTLRSAGAGRGTQAAMAAAALLTLPVAAYPLTAWAGARSALARATLAPREAELDQRLVEVTHSRARLVDAFEVERRRIERDLHDGAQQRLVALTVALGLAKLDLAPDSAAAEQVGAAHEQAKQALTELRELIRGVHPQVLTDRGLPAAIADAAGRSPVTVDVDVAVARRLPAGVEVAAYFAVCEALANVAKHSRARRASVRGRLVGDVLVVEVRDDGVGGADPAAGSGLAGLADRIAVVEGRLLLSSPAGGPTLLRVEIPCLQTAPSA
jgi:signal transduction histidine kinase